MIEGLARGGFKDGTAIRELSPHARRVQSLVWCDARREHIAGASESSIGTSVASTLDGCSERAHDGGEKRTYGGCVTFGVGTTVAGSSSVQRVKISNLTTVGGLFSSALKRKRI